MCLELQSDVGTRSMEILTLQGSTLDWRTSLSTRETVQMPGSKVVTDWTNFFLQSREVSTAG